MSQETFNFWVGLVLFLLLATVVVGIFFYGIWAYLHKTMAKNLDGEFFREPHFQPKELVNYQFFPLSLIKSMNYILLVAIPKLAINRRFKTLTGPPDVPRSTRLLCKVDVALLILILTIGLFLVPLMIYLVSIIA